MTCPQNINPIRPAVRTWDRSVPPVARQRRSDGNSPVDSPVRWIDHKQDKSAHRDAPQRCNAGNARPEAVETVAASLALAAAEPVPVACALVVEPVEPVARAAPE